MDLKRYKFWFEDSSMFTLMHFISCHQNLIFHFHTFDRKLFFLFFGDGEELSCTMNGIDVFSIVLNFMISLKNCNKISKKRLQ